VESVGVAVLPCSKPVISLQPELIRAAISKITGLSQAESLAGQELLRFTPKRPCG
jgi:hypothetical protein